MKIIAFEEHYVLPAIAEANPNSPGKLFEEVRSGRFGESGWPPGILDLGEARIAAMDAAGIDVQILSNVPGAEAVEVPLAVELASRNIEGVKLAAPNMLEPYDVLKHDLVLLSKDAAARLNHSLDPEKKPVVVPDVATIAPAAKPAKKEAAPKSAARKLTTKKAAKPKTKKGKG